MQAAEFAFTEQPGHSRGHVMLLLSLALVGAISPPEMEPPPPAETSPTSVEDPIAPSDSPVEPEAAVAPEAGAQETRPVEAPAAKTQPVLVETQPVPAQTSPSSDATPPGGYWTFAEQHERSREPLDGDDELTIGSVLFSLGFLRAGAGVLTAVMASNPEMCPLTQPRGCSGLRNYGFAGVAEGGLMIGTGLTYLIIGATRRERHRRWDRGEHVSSPRPAQSPHPPGEVHPRRPAQSPDPSGEGQLALSRLGGRPGAALNVVEVGPWLIPRSRSETSQARIGGAGLRLQLRF